MTGNAAAARIADVPETKDSRDLKTVNLDRGIESQSHGIEGVLQKTVGVEEAEARTEKGNNYV